MNIWKFSMWNKGISEDMLASSNCPPDESSMFFATSEQAAVVYFNLLRTGRYSKIKYEAIA